MTLINRTTHLPLCKKSNKVDTMFRIYVFTILACYFLYYCGTVLYDIYIRRTVGKTDTSPDEEAIDITEELKSFQPVIVRRPQQAKKKTTFAQRGELMMSGSIETNQLVPQISDFSTKGKLSDLGQIIELWTDG